jgi:hypothetical protein
LKSKQILNFHESSKFASAGQKDFFDTLSPSPGVPGEGLFDVLAKAACLC